MDMTISLVGCINRCEILAKKRSKKKRISFYQRHHRNSLFTVWIQKNHLKAMILK